MNPMPSFLTVGLLLVGLTGSVGTTAEANSMRPGHLTIVSKLAATKSPPIDKSKKPNDLQFSWRQACLSLGNSLRSGRGPWGQGIFTSYSCYEGDKFVTGAKKTGQWRLEISRLKDQLKLEILSTYSAKPMVLGLLLLKDHQKFYKFFADKEYVDLLAQQLMSQLPAAALLTKRSLKGDVLRLRHPLGTRKTPLKHATPEAPETLTIFRLAWDQSSGAWSPEVLGEAKRLKIAKPRMRKGKGGEKLSGGYAIFKIEPNIKQALAKEPLWAQDSRGPGAATDEATKAVEGAHVALAEAIDNDSLQEFLDGQPASLGDLLLESAASGYVGARYGMQLIPGDELLAKTSMVSLLAEFRGGPVEGLRYYFDILPTTTHSVTLADDTTKETSIGWARHVLGYSFAYDPGYLVDRITIDPKIGVWFFDAKLALTRNADGVPTQVDSFSLGRTISTSIGLGLEWTSGWYTLRTWAAFDTGYGLSKSGGSITSKRVGVDSYFHVGPTIPVLGVPFKTALLAFASFESIELAIDSDKDSESLQPAIGGVNYDGGYAGGGLAISW